MYRFGIPIFAFAGLLVALGAHSAAAQTGLDSMLRQFGERAIEEIVRPDPPPVTAPSTRTQRPQAPATAAGPTRAEVLEAQQLLVQLGYNPGVPDGLMGPNTARAISAFQGDAGRPQTGAVTNALIARLRSASAGPSGGGSQQVVRASFDCALAGIPAEFAICSNPELARLDRQMADRYASARADASNPSAVVNAQRNWISRRNGCGGDVDCLRDSMQRRLAELGGPPVPVGSSSPQSAEPAPSSPGLAEQTDVPTARNAVSDPGQEREQPSTASIREDGIRIHPSDRLIVPHPVRNASSPEARQYQALINHLQHAALAERIGSMAPAENPVFFADVARDYLSPSEFRPFLCTPDEMNTGSTDCMNSGDASSAYAMAGGQMNRTAGHSYLWWRGATEFDRRRSMQAFVESGLVDQVIAAAPEMPVRLIYLADGWLERYDFETGHFPFGVSGGIRPVEVPGSHSEAFDLADLVQPVSVPPEAAEPLLQQLPRDESGRSELMMGIEVDITLEDPGNESQRPRWQTQVVSSAYFLDASATQPLADVIDGVVGAGASAPDPSSAPAPGGTMAAGVMRPFDLLREDGRIVIDFESYGEPTSAGRDAIFYLFASAAQDYADAFEGDSARFGFGVLHSLLSDEVRARFFDCSTFDRCYNRTTGSYFAGENEFQARQAQTAFEQEIVPALIAEAPAPPIQMRIYLDARLSEYDFDDESFGQRVFQQARPEIEPLRRMFSFEPILALVPRRIQMSPDAAEALVTETQGDPVLRLDFDVLNYSRLGLQDTVMTVRPVAAALVTGAARDKVHYEETYDTPDDETAPNEAALAFLGPQTAANVVPQQPTAHEVMGVAPGMHVEAAREALLQSFDDRDIAVEDGILRAERGYCSYRGTIADVTTHWVGSVCLVARLEDQRVSRVSLQRIVHPGDVQTLIDETRARFGEPASRGDGDVPDGADLREYFGWGAELEATRAMLGRPEVALPAHEAEFDHIFVNPNISVVTLRADALPLADAPRAAGGGAASATQEVAPGSPAADGPTASDADHAAPEPSNGDAGGVELALLGIAPGMERAEARAILENRFGDAALAGADDGTLIAESGPCRYAAAADPAIETEAGSNCVMVVFGPDDAVSNIVVRYVVTGSHVDAYAAQLEGSFGAPASRVRSEQAPDTLILGWGPELEATAAEVERDASAGQTLHALEARLTQANGVTLATARLDSEPVLSGSAVMDEGDAGSAPPPIDF